MKISGIQKVSLVDFNEKISTTIFTNGCNFACPFCHNSGLVSGKEKEIPTSEILEYLTKRRNLLDAVVISGGEPTIHPDLPNFIKQVKDLGYIIKLDTNGTNLEMLKNLVDNNLIDYIAMDIKNSYEKYNLTIDKDLNLSIKDTIDYIMSCGIPYEFRTTLIKEFHSEQEIINISKMIKGANKYFLQKFEDNENCLKKGLHSIEKETAMNFLKILKKNIPNTYLRGY